MEIATDKAGEIAEEISHSLDTSHSAWYADFKTEEKHYIIFSNKVFLIDRTSKEQYDEAIWNARLYQQAIARIKI